MSDFNIFVTDSTIEDVQYALDAYFEYTGYTPQPIIDDLEVSLKKLKDTANSYRDDFNFSNVKSISVGKNGYRLYYRITDNEVDVVGFAFMKPKYETRHKRIISQRIFDLEEELKTDWELAQTSGEVFRIEGLR